ncbi:hypothetical protein GGF31_001627 [Allomyces arbusculus]|nr:hypothetical protein GGF31_001627 [Allomyces arbusculus]
MAAPLPASEKTAPGQLSGTLGGPMAPPPYAPVAGTGAIPMPIPGAAAPGGFAAPAGASLAAGMAAQVASERLTTAGLLPAQWSVEGLREYRAAKMQEWRSMGDFFDWTRFRRPGSWEMVKERVNANLSYYHANYLFIFVCICIYALITSPFLLLSLAFLVGAHIMVRRANAPTIMVFGQELSTTQVNSYLAILTIPLLWLGSAGSTVFWIVGASGLVIGGHAAMLEPPVERAFEQNV